MTDHPLPWRVGTKIGRNLYDAQGIPIGQLDTSDLARLAVDSVNDRHRFEAVEQELRETASALKEAQQYIRTLDAVMRTRIGEVEAHNAKATALLTRWRLLAGDQAYGVNIDTKAFLDLSRAPAQPAAPTAERNPALPTRAEIQLQQWDKPAAPEPSALQLAADALASTCTAARLRSAEAQLAATQEVAFAYVAKIDAVKTMAESGCLCGCQFGDQILALLTAPSPGAGEETL